MIKAILERGIRLIRPALDWPEHGRFLFLSIGWEQQNGVKFRFAKGRAVEGFVCIAEVKVAMIQSASSPCRAFDMLIEFRKSGSQVSFVKIPSYNKCSLQMYVFQFT